tara:strand:- start:6312 stop:7886 length:1575 start_codon:yes stop_codon:yes gene_type:complete
MSLSIIKTRAQIGINSPFVTVEVHLSKGLPGFNIVGLPETAVKESKDRVRSAIINSGFDFPLSKIIVNLAPADLPKEGGRYDLAIALGLLAASKQIPSKALKNYIFLGELALTGDLREVKSILPTALVASQHKEALFIPKENISEISFIDDLKVLAANSLKSVCEHFMGISFLEPINLKDYFNKKNKNNYINQKKLDISDVKGQYNAKRALEIAAAGGHSLLFYGSPGSGKTMLSSRINSILPKLNKSEALDVAVINSISNRKVDIDNFFERPFRAPHHTASAVSLVGGGSSPKPGEISLAHHGILFLDELPEFDRKVLEVLREPLESHKVTISRALRQVEFPARFQLIAAMNPCPCGYLGDLIKDCKCSDLQIKRYKQKLSGPLLDRIDMHVEVLAVKSETIVGLDKTSKIDNLENTSDNIRINVIKARDIQMTRQGVVNADITHKQLEVICEIDDNSRLFMKRAMEKLGLSARVYHRVLKLSRTIADLQNKKNIELSHITEAMSYRNLDKEENYSSHKNSYS